MKHKKVDANQNEVVRALEKVGATVQDIHNVGQGCPDILVGFRGKNYLLEIKGLKGTLNMREQVWHDEWAGYVYVVHTVDEALYAIGALNGQNPYPAAE